MSCDADLLERMEKDLRLAGKAERTVEAYTGAVRRLVRRTGKPLGEIEESDVREYLLDMVENQVARGTFSINLCGIRFFWKDTMGLDWKIFDLAKPRYDKKLPVVLSRDEVWRILDEVTIDVYRVCLTTIYSCGLRLLEGATLEIPQIDSARMQLHIHGKGGRDRFVPLPEGTLLMLREFLEDSSLSNIALPGGDAQGPEAQSGDRCGPDPPLEPARRLPSSARQGGHPQEGAHPHAAPLLRDAPARGRRESPADPDVSRALERAHDADLHPPDARGLRHRRRIPSIG